MQKEAPGDQAKQYQMMRAAYEKMHKALDATGRPIVFSLCQYGWDAVWEWGPAVGGNLWRTTGDIEDNWHEHVRHRLQPRPASQSTPAPATGTIPTCSKSATAR